MHQVGDELEHLVVGLGPAELTVLVLDEAVDGDVGQVDQLGHGHPPATIERSCSHRSAPHGRRAASGGLRAGRRRSGNAQAVARSEEHTSELQSLMRISYAVFCLKKKQYNIRTSKEIRERP